MSGVPYTFATATTSIPLSQLDANFATVATLGNASIGLGNTTSVVGNLTLQNVTITSGTSNITTNVASVTGILPQANGGTGTTTGYYGFKNRIINGAMVIDQRFAGGAFGTSINGYTLDRWNVYQSTTGKLNGSQNYNSVTPPTGFSNYLGVQSQSAYSVGSSDIFKIYQSIEGYNIADLAWGTANAKAVTLSFWVYSSLTGTFGGSLIGGLLFYPFSYSIPVANTWTQISLTVPGSTSGSWNSTNASGIQVNFGLGVGSTYSGAAGSWGSTNYQSVTGAVSVVGTNNATFYVTGIQFEVGTQATSFDYRPYGTELALCQRYYFQNTGLASTTTNFGSATSISATQAYIQVPFPVSMRTGPTISYGGTVNVSDSNTYDLAISAIVTNQSNTNYGSGKVTTASGQTLYRPQTLWVNSTTSFLAFTAEL